MLSFTAKDPSTIELSVINGNIEIGLTEEFISKNTTPYIYTIEPSVNSIHLNNKGKLNTSSLDVWVNVDGDKHIKITDQYILENLGLSVWYSIDDEDIRHKLVVGGEPLIEVEEGGAIIVSEDDENIFITLESETIDISAIRDKINLYLIKDADINGYGEEINKIYIPVTKDGGSYRAITEITNSNLSKYTSSGSIDIEKCSSFINLNGNFSSTLSLLLPSIDPSTTNSSLFETRKLIGSTLCLYNNSNQICSINGRTKDANDTVSTYNISSGNFAYFTCKCTVTGGKEDVYWECITGIMS